ncbi:hypothetical protein ACFFFP_08510 [Thermus composti]|mgnify:CR=1 FL=1|uniref:Uncharacterized protein n=1 Tax=Thermus composti TaxID=532059 RepID=A0ABV6Q3P4_9DEIN|nr:hypothetical protein [Thermus composti]
MEWTPEGKLLVSEHTAGTVRDISKGGDASESKPLAFHLRGPAAIRPTGEGKVLVAETWGGTITDIANGGDARKLPKLATNLKGPYTLAILKKKIFVSESRSIFMTQITCLTLADRGIEPKVYISDIPARHGEPGLTPPESWPDKWEKYAAAGCVKNWIDDAAGRDFFYLAVGNLGQIFRIKPDEMPEQITYSELIDHPNTLVAWGLHRLGGMRFHPPSGLLFAVQPEMGEVIAIDPAKPGNYHFQPPVVRGFRMPTCVRFSQDFDKMYVCSSADGVVWQVEGFLD